MSLPRDDDGRGLRHVRAAQLRGRAIRWGIGKSMLGTVFLVGAIAHAYGPDPQASGSLAWMSGLIVLSTLNVALGLRTFARVWRRGGRYWLPAALLWGALASILLRVLVGRSV